MVVEDSQRVFDKVCEGDIINCSTMIVRFAKNRHAIEDFEIFRQMLRNSVMPNLIIVINFLLVCGDSVALQ